MTCENRTANYGRREISFLETQTDFWLTTVAKVGQDGNLAPNITAVSRGTNEDSVLTSLAIGSNLTYPSLASEQERDNIAPLHVILVAGYSESLGQVFECTYSGREVLVEVTMSGPDAPLVIGPVKTLGPFVGPRVKRLVAGTIHGMLASGNGAALTRGFIDARYAGSADNLTDFASVLGTVLSQSAQAVISTMRQKVELANLYHPPETEAEIARLTIRLSVQRLGGGGYGWLVVYGVLLLGSLAGLLRAAVGGEAVAFEAQDAPILLAQAVGDETLGPSAKVQFVPGAGLVRVGGTVVQGHQKSREDAAERESTAK